jgi:hypothetical protein
MILDLLIISVITTQERESVDKQSINVGSLYVLRIAAVLPNQRLT